ncbi:hypothetical protein Stsp01_12510 [Streptomyces sp. NBRC 13847]|nr:hypothetical protein Stsp01_12510 [Streptomyces sp. NBRC 13847]
MPTFSAPDGTELAFHVVGTDKPLLCLLGGPMRASPRTSETSVDCHGNGS